MSAMCQDATADPSATIAELRRERDAALARETALAELLQIINSSPGDPAPVFDAILEKATRLCEAACGQIATYDGEQFRWVAVHGDAPFVAEQLAREPMPPSFGVTWPRIVGGEGVVNIADLKDTDLYRAGHESARSGADVGGARSLLSIALRKEDVLRGILTVYRQELRPFTDRETALLQSFAAQAVIAMENARLLTETREALDQQTATAEVLGVINSSPGDLAPVFDAMLDKAMRLCGVDHAALELYDGERFHAVAVHGASDRFADMLRQGYRAADSPASRTLIEGGRFVQIADAAQIDLFTFRAAAELDGIRTVLFVPLRRDDALLGMIASARREVRLFSDKEIALLENFAAQAVIAMENARLITETREALAQQTATAEVLQVINSSPGDLAPVFDAMLDKATRLCEAAFGTLWTYDGERFKAVALQQVPKAYADFLSQAPLFPNPRSGLGRIAGGDRFAHFSDVAADEAYQGEDLALRALVELGKAHTTVGVPLRKDDKILGAITAYRQEVRPFSDKQIALLQNFAAQAVIAMENARLLTETRDALEQQTATTEVLQVINASPGELQPVFEAVLEKATHLCDAAFGILWTFDRGHFHPMVWNKVPPAFAEFLRTYRPETQTPNPAAGLASMLRGDAFMQLMDAANTELYRSRRSPLNVAFVELGGARTGLIVPLRKDGVLLGAIRIFRQEVRPFTDKQIALLQTFADQAVIAMENARLLTETREALEQQTATAEVLQVINSSPGDLAPVFDAVIENSMRLCEATQGHLYIYADGQLHAEALRGEPQFIEWQRRRGSHPVTPGSPTERALRGEQVIHIADATQIDTYRSSPAFKELIDRSGIRTGITVALRRDEAFLGTINVYRQEVKPFTDKQIALLQNFAAQAVIAMENARLLTETREALEQQTATAEVLQVINSSPGDLAPVFNAILEKAHSLCGVAYGSLHIYDGERFHAAATHNLSEEFVALLREGFRGADNPVSRPLLDGARLVHIPDLAEIEDPTARAAVELGGIRTALFLPLRRDDALLGMIVSARPEVRLFADREIALLQNFSAQAVIAMENARLLTETREALEQQTATAEVLQVINSSPGDLAPVFDAMLEKAMRLCEAHIGFFMRYEGQKYAFAAGRGLKPEFAEYLARMDQPGPDEANSRVAEGAPYFHVVDMKDDAPYRLGAPFRRATVDLGGGRTGLSVPMHKDKELLGTFSLIRYEVRPFSDKQIALVQNFAAQAVIAMENARLLGETREALEQQTATAEVLQVINSSPGDLAPVFEAILEKAHTLCGAAHGSLTVADGEYFRAVAMRGMPEELAAVLRRPFRIPGRLAELAGGDGVVHIADLTAAQFSSDDPIHRAATGSAGARTLLAVALRKDDVLLGYITANRQEVRPFTDKQIALLQNFAAQAVIAMENARLLTETREALDQQTATAEVLGVINSSPGDLAPVFDAILEKAHSLCGVAYGSLQLYDGEKFRAVATRGFPEALQELLRQPYALEGDGTLHSLISDGRFVQIPDLADHLTRAPNPRARMAVDAAGIRTLLFVPLRKENLLLGLISAGRKEARPFSEKQIALLQNFAAQAVIAMENARLITETREALEQQTATAEVLQVINSSPGDLAPVFEAMLDRAIRLCEAAHGHFLTYDGETFHPAAVRGEAHFAEYWRQQGAFRPSAGNPLSRLLHGERIIHMADAREDDAYRDVPAYRRIIDIGGIRTSLTVPLRKDGALLGAVRVYRREVRPFTGKQVALVENFAAQAVIAMENARLLTETREALEYQTATSDVLQVISRSTFDLGPVLEYVVETAIRLCRAHMGSVFRLEGGLYRWAAGSGLDPAYREIERQNPIAAGPETLVGRVALEGGAVQIADALADPDYAVKDEARLTRARTMLGVPLLRDGAPIGVIAMARDRVAAFTDKEIALVTTFADQAVIAIENARLLNDLQGRTRDLQGSLEYQTATSDVLRVISRSGGELDPVLQTLVETAARLCDAEMALLHRRDNERYRLAANYGFPPEFVTFLQDKGTFALGRGAITGRAVIERRAVHVHDLAADPEFTVHEAITLGTQRTGFAVPLLREGEPIGVISLARHRVEPFTDRQIALVTTFADQAVIAIENARLFNELRARTAELGRSVDELRVLNEVGQAISSTLDLRTVLTTTLARSVALAGADSGAVFRYSRAEREFRLVDGLGWSPEFSRKVADLRVGESETAMGEAAATRMPLQIPDLALRPSAPLRDAALAEGLRGVLIVPLVGPERILGAMVLQRRGAGEFPAETVRLMQTLASQSVLAIQNARLFREIAEKSEQLALASEHKSQFLANMSHELRTPLNAILGYAELLVDGIYGALPEKAQGVLERVQNNGKHLLALINDVLDLAKIEAGQLALTIEDYSLPELVKTVVVATEPLAAAKGLKFTAAVEDGMPRGHGDARRLAQVLLNLVGNAIKFTDAGEVEIRAVIETGQFVLTVRDTGPGIADADQDRIFGEFQQIDNTNTRKKGGTGLGLAISKRMVEMQGGMITVESVLGQGSAFRVVLPVHVEPALEEAAD